MSAPEPASYPGTPGIDALAHELAQGLPPGSLCSAYRLPNGLWLLAAEVPTAHLVRLAGAIDLGYLDEPDDCRGLAHLLEHCLFLGSQRWPAVDALSRWVGEQGGRYNAHTGECATDVHLHLPAEAADEGLARLCDLLIHPRLDPAMVAHEVGIIDAEFQARRADSALHRQAALSQLCHPSHPAAHCHAGSISTLGSDHEHLATRLRELHNHYRPERMALAMLGPQPLAEQLAMLKHHATTLVPPSSTGAGHLSPRVWRWSEPAAVAWLPSQNATDSGNQLELLWPLPADMARDYRAYLDGVAARLNDGALAATLMQATSLKRLKASLAYPGGGHGLSLQLELGAEPPVLTVLVATLHQALAEALLSPLFISTHASLTDGYLDHWSRQQACRFAGQRNLQRYSQTPTNPGTLSTWLSPDQCRLLWRPAHKAKSPERGNEDHPGWRTLSETGTQVKRFPLPLLEMHRTLPHCIAPSLVTAVQPAPRPSAEWLQWRGSPPWTGAADISHLALHWIAGQRNDQRLHVWQQRTLALSQAALSQGAALRLGSDAQGDWLLATGSANQVQALAEQASAVRPDASPSQIAVPNVGLIAQRLLNRLEHAPPPNTPAQASITPAGLCWASGDLDNARLPFVSDHVTRPFAWPPAEIDELAAQDEVWLAPQATDHAVMLEVMAREASPRSRWLLRLLGQSHDAAFQQTLRQQQGLGYVAAVRYREAAGWPRLGYVVQSPNVDPTTLRRAIEHFHATQAAGLASLTANALATQRRGLLARYGPPETYPEALLQVWQRLRQQSLNRKAPPAGLLSSHWLSSWQEETTTLEHLTPRDLSTIAGALVNGELPQRWWYHCPG